MARRVPRLSWKILRLAFAILVCQAVSSTMHRVFSEVATTRCPMTESMLGFRDPSGLAHYPVDGPQLAKSQVVLRLFEPEDHCTRQLTIPAIHLSDWESN